MLIMVFYRGIITKEKIFMSVFSVGLSVLFVMSAIFYIVFFSFIFYWHLRKRSFVFVPFVFTFEFFVIGFFVVALVSIILDFLPEFIRAIGI